MGRVVTPNFAKLEDQVAAALRTSRARTPSRWERREVGHVTRRTVDEDPGKADGKHAAMYGPENVPLWVACGTRVIPIDSIGDALSNRDGSDEYTRIHAASLNEQVQRIKRSDRRPHADDLASTATPHCASGRI